MRITINLDTVANNYGKVHLLYTIVNYSNDTSFNQMLIVTYLNGPNTILSISTSYAAVSQEASDIGGWRLGCAEIKKKRTTVDFVV